MCGPLPTFVGSATRARVADVVSRLAASIARSGVAPQEVFCKIDMNQDGSLSQSEFEGVLQRFEPGLLQSECQLVFDMFDQDQSGNISVNEFCQILGTGTPQVIVPLVTAKPVTGMNAHATGQTGRLHLPPRVEDVLTRLSVAIRRMSITPYRLFQELDLDHDGQLSHKELQRVILRLRPDLPASECFLIFNYFDKDANGGVNSREFTNVLNSMACELAMRKCERNLEVKRQTILKEEGGKSESSQDELDFAKSDSGDSNVNTGGRSEYGKGPFSRVDEVLTRLAGSTARLGVTPEALFDRLVAPGRAMSRAEFDRFILSFQSNLTDLERQSLFEKFCSHGNAHIERFDFCRVLQR